MSGSRDFDENQRGREGIHPRSGKHPIPTVQGYREHRRELRGQLQETQEAQKGPEDEAKPRRALNSVRAIFKDEDKPGTGHDPYPVSNHNYAERPVDESQGDHDQESSISEDTRPSTSQSRASGQADEQTGHDGSQDQGKGETQDEGKGKGPEPSATEAVAGALDPRQKRKAMKKAKRDTGGREVTDPVTHLPILIHDQTDKDLRNVPQNVPEPGTDHLTATGLQGASKDEDEIQLEQEHLQKGYTGMKKMFPPPDFEDMRIELGAVYNRAVKGGLALISAAAAIFLGFPSFRGQLYPSMYSVLGFASFVATAFGVALGMGRWIDKKANEIFEDETWDAARREENETLDTGTELPESVQWFNRLISSIWPLVNPDLFSSLIDQIEDIMQASLPKFVKMVSVDDMGQGNESIRILGVRWLPSGAASMTRDSDGKLKKPDSKASSDRTNPENGQQDDGNSSGGDQGEGEEGKSKEENDEEVAIREGMEAEEGDFVNLELAVSYRSRSSGKGIKSKAKNAHLFLKFYLPGGVPVPIWVELRGFVAIMRVRLQLTPDPPFVSLCTLTFLGQPRARISCVPISKHSVNMLDIPLISSFVQSAIDAAMAEYVAPKSLTLNLKDMLVGADFKKDTISRGVVWIYIKQARGFKQGDGGLGPIEGSSDSYVTCSWGKFGKPVASTRIIESSQEPNWHEFASILVTPEELNAEEKLRLQLWDSDKWTADDDLGRVQVDLKKLMSNPESHNKMQDREDRFTGQDSSEKMAGSLVWSVGYFDKAKITADQLEKQTVLPDIRTKEQLKQHVSDTAERKLREANKAPQDEEIKQQKAQDYQALENDMICSAPPDPELPSGILSVVIKNITGLGIQNQNKVDSEDKEDEAQQDDDMPDGYCTIIINHRKIYRTRTKPKNSKPFFNAGTERFVRDWRDTEVIISVRDAREREADPLIGIIYLPLSKVLAGRSQVMENYPLIGGVGYGRARVSLCWRSVNLKLPRNLRGWDYGTLEIRGAVKARQGLPDNLKGHRIKIRTNMGRCKLYPENGEWKQGNKNESSFLAVRKRYASPLVIEFRESTFGPDRTPAFAIFWLQDLVDEEDETRTIKVWKGGKANQARAESCAAYDGMEEGEQPLGEVELSLVFWRGLSGYHKSYAANAKSDDMRQVMECLDTVTDQNLGDDFEDESDSDSDESGEQDPNAAAKKKLQVHTNDDSSMDEESDGESDGSSSSNPSLSDLKKAKKVKKILRNPVDGGIEAITSVLAPGHIDSNDSSRGLRNQLRDYKDHKNQLHRKHKGIMQWRIAREADHLGGKLGRLGNLSRLFQHGSKSSGIETEV